MRALVLILGCGFHGIANIGVDAGADLAGIDLATTDLATNSPDLSGVTDLAMPVLTGPGPLGALPAGFCCASNQQCRSRSCIGSGYCSDTCRSDGDCNGWVSGVTCNLSTDTCEMTSGACRPADQYQYGTKPIRSCCVNGIHTSGQECLGGICVTTGADSNPFYCTQGCDSMSPCPGGYSCFGGFCWISQTVGDNTYLYMCQ